MGHPIRETIAGFWSRVEREGRRPEVESILAELLAAGRSKRAAQAELVERFQPLDGTIAKAWQTPNSWDKRRFWKTPSPDSKQRLEEDLQWVYHNHERDVSDAPTSGARWWMEVAKKRPAEFMRIYREALSDIVSREDRARWSKMRPTPAEAARKARVDQMAYGR